MRLLAMHINYWNNQDANGFATSHLGRLRKRRSILVRIIPLTSNPDNWLGLGFDLGLDLTWQTDLPHDMSAVFKSIPVPLPDLYFDWFSYPVACIAFSDMSLFLLLFNSQSQILSGKVQTFQHSSFLWSMQDKEHIWVYLSVKTIFCGL